jgi:AcrR family transcriptional regulator
MSRQAPLAVNRRSLATAALELVQEQGLDALTMRSLADRTGVKAASLYWHVRDREELLELVADALLARVSVRASGADWRRQSLAICMAAGAAIGAQRDGDRILLSVPGAIRRSGVYGRLVTAITGAPTDPALAREVAAMLLGFVVTQPSGRCSSGPPLDTRAMTLAVDSGSRGVIVHAGGAMETLFRIPLDTATAAPAVIRDERVVVRRLRGGKRGEIEVNPAHPWRMQVQGPTWNTLLDLRGLDLTEVHLDSGANKVECILPRPRGVVPIQVSGGVIKTVLRRIPGTAVVADISSGAVQVRLDDHHLHLAIGDSHWETPDAGIAPDRYELRISGGAVRVTLDGSAPEAAAPVVAGPEETRDAGLRAVLGVVLDGVAAHSHAPGSGSSGATGGL